MRPVGGLAEARQRHGARGEHAEEHRVERAQVARVIREMEMPEFPLSAAVSSLARGPIRPQPAQDKKLQRPHELRHRRSVVFGHVAERFARAFGLTAVP